MSFDEDGPPPLDDFDDDGPPPLDDLAEDAAAAKPSGSTNSSLLDLEKKIEDPFRPRRPDEEISTPAHDALIAKLKPKPKPAPKKEEPKDPTTLFAVGDTVEVGGLQGAPQHNGKLGVVQRFDAEKGRFVLKIAGMKKPLAVKPGNLTMSKPLAKGFLDSAAAAKEPKGKKGKKGKKDDDDDVIEIVTPKFKEAEQDSKWKLDEVQQALGAATEKQSEWMNGDFMSRFQKNPRLMKGFTDPRCQKAMAEMQEDPEAASKKYKDDKQVSEFLREFMGLMGDHFSNLADDADRKAKDEAEKKAKEEQAAQAQAQAAAMGPMSDPKVQAIMSDPEFQPILQMCGQPGYFTRFMNDPRYGPKLQYLLDKNVFQMHT
eukprot:COSAG06_NODE_2549_length_6687_cov_142.924256_1_plen_372_part_00